MNYSQVLIQSGQLLERGRWFNRVTLQLKMAEAHDTSRTSE